MAFHRHTISLVVLFSGMALVAPLQSRLAFAPKQGTIISRPHLVLFAEDNDESSSGGIMSMKSLQSQLASAFTALDESDQYDAVLTGLCAKILDQPQVLDGESSSKTLQDPIQLVEEMNSRRIKASPRSLMAFIDAAVTTQDAKIMAQIMSLGRKNGGISQFGNLQGEITPMPGSPLSKVRCPDGSTKTRLERLADVPEVPSDDRSIEVTSALAVAGIVGFCGTVNVLNLDAISPFTNVVWFLILTIGLTDNFYDLAKFGVKTFAKDKVGELPDELPLGIGSGAVSGTVVKGFNRLLKVDTERESECEAAAFYTAYTLGLPVFSFRPNALEAAVLVAESTLNDNQLDPLLSTNGIMKVLVWLMAPAAMESMKYPELIQSDPREAAGFLTRLENSDLINRAELWWLGDEQERLDMLKWAYTEADLLIRRNQAVVNEISLRLTGGAATVADCVAAVEDW